MQFKLQEVWTLVDLPNGKRAIGTKWVYKNKKDERGIVIKNKVRLVAQGYTQEEGIDYVEVFAPVARIKAIRLFLAYASFKDLVVYQMDVKSAFLYGKIEEDVYVCQPPGFEDPDFPDRVYKVEKTLYGLDKCRIHISVCTDKSQITRKQSKSSKHGHENQKSSKRSQRFKAEARKAKPQSKSAKKNQKNYITKPSHWPIPIKEAHVDFEEAQVKDRFYTKLLTKETQAVIIKE
ncbi:putative ribonuclease H-like domain-containing protein [Tanacetum coccineum]